jgi:hypothetical protein
VAFVLCCTNQPTNQPNPKKSLVSNKFCGLSVVDASMKQTEEIQNADKQG